MTSKQKMYIFKPHNLSLIVLSSKNYEYLWNNFSKMWNANCSNLKIKKFFFTTNKNKKYKNFQVLSGSCGTEDPWGKRILQSLKKVKTRNVLLIMDDYFVTKKLNIKEFKKCYDFFLKNKISYLRIFPSPNENFFDKRNIYFVPYHSFHRISLQASLWKKAYLANFLKVSKTPHQFEEIGSLRTKKNDLIYSTNHKVINYIEFVRSGKITPEAMRYIKKNKLKINKNYHYMNLKKIILHYLGSLKFFFFYLLSKKIRKFYIKMRHKKYC